MKKESKMSNNNSQPSECKEPTLQMDVKELSALHSSCVDRMEKLLTYSFPVYRVLGEIEKAGCELPPQFISCR